MRVRILTIGDPHIQMRHLHRVRKMISEILRVARETQPDRIVVLGDILHTHSRLHMTLQCMAFDFLEELAQIAPVRLLVGNHDRINNSDFMTNVHPFRGLENNPKIWVVWKTMTEDVGLDKELVYVPYVAPGRFLEALTGVCRKKVNPEKVNLEEVDPEKVDLEEVDPEKVDLEEVDLEKVDLEEVDLEEVNLEQVHAIFAHQEVRGCALGPGVVSEVGDPWSLEFPVVFSGHIHGRQIVQPNWIYVGAPTQHSHGDSADRGLSMLSFENSGYEEERIRLEVPLLITLEVTTEELMGLEIPENAEVRVKVIGTSAQLKAVPDRIWKALKSQGVQVDKKTQGLQRTHDFDSDSSFVDLLMKRFSPEMQAELQKLLPDPWEL